MVLSLLFFEITASLAEFMPQIKSDRDASPGICVLLMDANEVI